MAAALGLVQKVNTLQFLQTWYYQVKETKPRDLDVSSKQYMFWLAFSRLISLFSNSSKMADGINLFGMTESAINALKKPEIVKRIIELKNKVVVGEEIKSLCTHIKELRDTVNQLLSKNERLSSDLAIQKTVW